MSNCKRCGKPIVWPQPYVKGDRPLEDDGSGNPHDCPEFNNNRQQTQQQQQAQTTTATGQSSSSQKMEGLIQKLAEQYIPVTQELQRLSTFYDDILNQARITDAKVDRLLAMQTHSKVDPKEQESADKEARYDQDKEDGTLGNV